MCWRLGELLYFLGQILTKAELEYSGDALHVEALQMFMSTFNFTHNALDVALRKLLMQISLPKETQQIDRVIEAFAKQYEKCEPGLFGEKGK